MLKNREFQQLKSKNVETKFLFKIFEIKFTILYVFINKNNPQKLLL